MGWSRLQPRNRGSAYIVAAGQFIERSALRAPSDGLSLLGRCQRRGAAHGLSLGLGAAPALGCPSADKIALHVRASHRCGSRQPLPDPDRMERARLVGDVGAHPPGVGTRQQRKSSAEIAPSLDYSSTSRLGRLSAFERGRIRRATTSSAAAEEPVVCRLSAGGSSQERTRL